MSGYRAPDDPQALSSYLVDVAAVTGTGRLAVDEHAEPCAATARSDPHDEVQIAGVKEEGDPPARLVQRCLLVGDRPGPSERPVILRQLRRDRITPGATHRGKALRPRPAHVGLGRAQARPVRLRLDAVALFPWRRRPIVGRRVPGLGQELPDELLRLLVVALACSTSWGSRRPR
jgi:hypothetical protein